MTLHKIYFSNFFQRHSHYHNKRARMQHYLYEADHNILQLFIIHFIW